MLYIIMTIVYGLFLLALWVGIGYGFYYIIFKPSREDIAAKKERARKMSDRRGWDSGQW